MPPKLLPTDFDASVTKAVATFWKTRAKRARAKSAKAQGGTRSKVVAGKNLDGFLEVVTSVVAYCGLPADCVYTKGRNDLTLPGYFRVTKKWDTLIIFEGRLLAAIEFKSQVGSFGNNANNRTEEVLGNSYDFFVAHSDGLFLRSNYIGARSVPENRMKAKDPRPPFLGYLMLLEESTKSTSSVQISSPHFSVDRAFRNASYARRYKLLCDRMMTEQLYDRAALMLSPEGPSGKKGEHRSLTNATSVTALFSGLAAKVRASQ